MLMIGKVLQNVCVGRKLFDNSGGKKGRTENIRI